jgi:hypothetical protein
MADGGEEYRFRIDVYSPETLPMIRLAEYLHQLAVILGEPRAVHFVRLDGGSTTVIHKIETEAVPRVRGRARAVARRQAPRDAMRAYEIVNRMLRVDNGVGALQETSGAEIIHFPGREDLTRFGSISQQCSVDGEVIRVGGTRERVPITLRSEEELIADCYTGRATAKKLALHLFEPVRLFGTGRFIREATGAWKLEYFVIDSFDPLNDEPLSSVVVALRAIAGGQWSEDALGDLRFIRHGPIEAQDGGI